MSNIEGRCITIARVRAGLTSAKVACLVHYTPCLVRDWERGVRTPHYEELYDILPELPEIREKGCVAYCPKANVCKKDGKCPMARAAKTEGYLAEDLVHVVRCKYCEHRKAGICELFDIETLSSDFCSFGKRGDRHG